MFQLGWLWPCPQILRPDWKGFPSLLGLIISDEGKKFYNIETWITAASASGAPPLAAADDDEADDETDDQHDHPKPAKLRRGEADRVEEADLN